MTAQRWMTMLLALSLTACALTDTPPISYLQLRSAEGPPPAGDRPVILVDAVQLPDYLLRNELLRRRDDYSMRYDPFQRWAEPLDLGIQRAIAGNLERLLDTHAIARFPGTPVSDAYWRLTLEIHQFELDGERVQLRADGLWRCVNIDASICNIRVDFEDSKALSPAQTADAARIAASLSELLEAFAATLADALPEAPSQNEI